ncbi:hypothetical protein DFH06DRAFT_390602 [Mycena polygramma]|nr:hypothetical protein DFH06DRAFT_390602 [Mycena polygramma]
MLHKSVRIRPHLGDFHSPRTAPHLPWNRIKHAARCPSCTYPALESPHLILYIRHLTIDADPVQFTHLDIIALPEHTTALDVISLVLLIFYDSIQIGVSGALRVAPPRRHGKYQLACTAASGKFATDTGGVGYAEQEGLSGIELLQTRWRPSRFITGGSFHSFLAISWDEDSLSDGLGTRAGLGNQLEILTGRAAPNLECTHFREPHILLFSRIFSVSLHQSIFLAHPTAGEVLVTALRKINIGEARPGWS